MLAETAATRPARAAGPGGAPLPGPARPRRRRTRPHRGPLADHRQARRRQRVRPVELDAGRRGEGAGRRWSRSCRPTGRRGHPHPRPAARRRAGAVGRPRPRLRHGADPAHRQAARGRHHRPRPTWSTPPPARARPAPGSARRSPPPGPAGWPATAASPASSSAPTGQPLDLGRTHRVVPPHLRRARSRSATAAACSPAATPRPTGATSTTCRALDRRRRDRPGEPRPALRTPPHQGPPRLPHRTTTRRPMAHLPPRRHRDPHLTRCSPEGSRSSLAPPVVLRVRRRRPRAAR